MLYRYLLTPSRLRVLREATKLPEGRWKPVPYAAGEHRMCKRLAKDGFGSWDAKAKVFTINDKGHDAAREG